MTMYRMPSLESVMDPAEGTIYHPPGAIRLPTPAETDAARAAAHPAPAPNSALATADRHDADGDATATPILPALDRGEWNRALESAEAVTTLLEQHVQAAAALPAEDAAEHLRAAAALSNHLLPDGHPRKITWGTVDALRSALVVYHDAVGATFGPLGVRRHPWHAMVNTTDVLGSLLPPR